MNFNKIYNSLYQFYLGTKVQSYESHMSAISLVQVRSHSLEQYPRKGYSCVPVVYYWYIDTFPAKYLCCLLKKVSSGFPINLFNQTATRLPEDWKYSATLFYN